MERQAAVSPTSSELERRFTNGNIADIVGFLSLGGEAAYVGSSSGFSLATNLGQMVQATVWNKALVSTVNQTQSKPLSIAELKKNSAGPPNDDMYVLQQMNITILDFPDVFIRALVKSFPVVQSLTVVLSGAGEFWMPTSQECTCAIRFWIDQISWNVMAIVLFKTIQVRKTSMALLRSI